MRRFITATLLALILSSAAWAAPVKRVLFIGDSMTGWLAERMEAYGELNGFAVSTVIWDGSTLPKWTKTGKIPSFMATYKPDVVFICLGLNEMLVRDPAARMAAPLATLRRQLGQTPMVWIGPPSWPGKSDGAIFNRWMASHLPAPAFYFNSSRLQLPRQSKTNPHPTRSGCAAWMDAVMKWLPSTSLQFPANIITPPTGEMKRGKNYIYRRMKQAL